MFFFSEFNDNISNWNVSKVKNMGSMFKSSTFTQDISNWDVSCVENMNSMFSQSEFNSDISKWNVSNVKNMDCMFQFSTFNQDISGWDVSSLESMVGIFNAFSKKNKNVPDLTNWKPYNLETVDISSRDLPEPLPYWALVNTPSERAKAIDTYLLNGQIPTNLNSEHDIIRKIKMNSV
jgi:surface protein